MEDEEGYTTLNLRPNTAGSAGPPRAGAQGIRQGPPWPTVALGVGNIILGVTVVFLMACVLHVVSEKRQIPAAPDCDGAGRGDTAAPPDCDSAGSGDVSTAECSTSLEHFRSQLTQRLCRPARSSPAVPGCAIAGSFHSRTMEDEEGYTTLNLRPKKGGSAGLPPARNQGSHQCPHWPLVALGAGNIILSVAVLSLGVCVSQLLSKGQTLAAPGNDRAGNGDTGAANCSSPLEHFRSNLTQRLCPPARPGPAGGSGCKLCPTDWRLWGDKCYWVSRDSKLWSESRSDCAERGSRLLVIRDRAELESLQDLIHGTRQFWVGLSVPSAEKGWTWLDGSRLDRTLIPGPGQAEEGNCGAVKEKRINSESCSSALQWICQRDAVLI